jgi:hypothetical protein
MNISTARFKFIANALNGSGGFKDGSYIIKYPRESDEKYERRKEIAWYVNDLKEACLRFVGYLSRKSPSRILNNDLLDLFAQDCDWQGNSLDVLWSDFTIDAKARGIMLLLVDMPAANQETDRTFPYIASIVPEIVDKYEVNERGLITWIEITGTTIVDGKTVDILRGWDITKWWVRKGTTFLSQGDHNLGVCPVISFAESTFPLEGSFAQIADVSKRLYNARSELDEILRSQTFSILTYQTPPQQMIPLDVATVAGQIGTNNMLIHSGETPSFVAPPSGPSDIYIKVIADLQDKIGSIGHILEPIAGDTGIALNYKFQQINSALSQWATKLLDTERKIWDLVCLWLGLENKTQISWERDFSTTDLTNELNILAAMQTGGFSIETLGAMRKRILGLAFPAIPDEQMAELMNAEDQASVNQDVLPTDNSNANNAIN